MSYAYLPTARQVAKDIPAGYSSPGIRSPLARDIVPKLNCRSLAQEILLQAQPIAVDFVVGLAVEPLGVGNKNVHL